jgi:hypothetical protein
MTFSKWSHVGLVLPDVVVEATWPCVKATPIAEFLAKHPDREFRTLEGAPEVVMQEIGKPYDVSGLFMLLNPWRDWNTDDKWFCSELIASATNLFTESSRVTPQMLYLVSRGDKTA